MPTILLIDDDEILLNALTRFLKREGFEVQACGNGKDALEHLDRHSYDLVITDINMPYANGFEVMTWIRSEERHKGIPVIAMTSMSSESFISQCYRTGASDFLPKPIMPRELNIRVRKLLEA
jgi:DNA-binding response OmpR family regulator